MNCGETGHQQEDVATWTSFMSGLIEEHKLHSGQAVRVWSVSIGQGDCAAYGYTDHQIAAVWPVRCMAGIGGGRWRATW